MDKRQFLEQMIEDIRSMDMSNIIGRYISLPKRVSGGYQGLCPFHNDTRLGSFVVTPRKGIFKCFACDAGGDAIKFVSLYRGVNYVEAAFQIGLDENIITSSEYEEYFGKRRYYKKEIKNIERAEIRKAAKKNKSNKASNDVLNLVFGMFLSFLKLSSQHEEYLKRERKLSKEIIEERAYRSYPTPGAMKKLVKAIEENKDNEILKRGAIRNKELDKGASFVDAVLSTIPGFFQKEKKGEWEWTFPYNKGILIPIRNAKGLVVGLQVRRDRKDEDRGRYFWFSSSFALYNDSFKYGTSSGSPLDVLYPKDKKPSQVLFITEGRFKSEAIVENINSVCISVQGVGNWHNIYNEIKVAEKRTKENYPDFRGFTRVYIAFDSDMSYKYQVYQQLKRMSDHIEKKEDDVESPLRIFYLHWTEGFKGIDDLLLSSDLSDPNTLASLFTVHRKEYWDNEYEKQLRELLKKKKLRNTKDLTQDDLIIGINIKKEKKKVKFITSVICEKNVTFKENEVYECIEPSDSKESKKFIFIRQAKESQGQEIHSKIAKMHEGKVFEYVY